LVNLLSEVTNLDESQNTDPHQQELIPLEAQETSRPQPPGTAPPASIEVKERTASHSQPENQSSNPNSQLQTDMEVHKHPHHVTHKKKWNEYLLEFLMLFLAVFLGFLAENFREHEVEREREKQYMQSLVYDLQNDTANLNNGFPLKDDRIKAIDSFFMFFAENPDAPVIPGYVFRHIRRSLWDRHYRRNTTTMDQLNAGGLRLIRKQAVADSIAAYDLLWQRAEFWRDGYVRLQDKGKSLVYKLVQARTFLSTYKHPLIFSSINGTEDSFPVKINLDYLDEFLNFSDDQKIWTRQDKAAYEAIEKSAERLIALIRKEYRLD